MFVCFLQPVNFKENRECIKYSEEVTEFVSFTSLKRNISILRVEIHEIRILKVIWP